VSTSTSARPSEPCVDRDSAGANRVKARSLGSALLAVGAAASLVAACSARASPFSVNLLVKGKGLHDENYAIACGLNASNGAGFSFRVSSQSGYNVASYPRVRSEESWRAPPCCEGSTPAVTDPSGRPPSRSD
jgi:hypothetical protein